MDAMFYLAVMLFCGLLFGRIAKFFKMPNVTGYLVAGLLIGPYFLNIVPLDMAENFKIISNMALGFIAFSVGNEFKASYFKRVGFAPVVIAFMEAMVAVILVIVGLVATGQDPAFSIVLGSIAAATAPAATIMVIKQYQAKGPVTETLMSVVAMDDAVALIAFGFAVTIAKAMRSTESVSIFMSILEPFIEVFFSLVIGGLLGILFTIPLRWFKKDSNRMAVIIGFVFLASSLATYFDLSALLTCMAMGAVFTNVYRSSGDVLKIADYITPPLFMLFFITSGAELDIHVIPSIGLVGIIYVVLRVAGKLLGAMVSSKWMKSPATVQKYLGFTLIPQAGVAIGLSLLAEQVVPEHASAIRAVVLCATLIYEIVGPVASKIALQKAGEIKTA